MYVVTKRGMPETPSRSVTCHCITITMIPQLARPHNHLSNRAKVRAALERKPVFKSVLQNPFQICWYASVPVPFKSTANHPQAVGPNERSECCSGSPRGRP